MSVTEFAKELTEPINKLLVPIASSAGATLQDIWELVFGGFGTYVDKKRLSRAKSIEDFKESLVSKVVAIPENHIQDPQLAIVGPALDASKYYFEEEELREMFANLVSAALDDRMNHDIHPSFIEIIKQMSPLDAQILAEIETSAPVAQYRTSNPNGGFAIIKTNIFLEHSSEQNIEKTSVSITSLVRLGLVSVDYDKYQLDTQYEKFEETSLFGELQMEIQKQFSDRTVVVHPGVVQLTPLGNAFKRVCLR